MSKKVAIKAEKSKNEAVLFFLRVISVITLIMSLFLCLSYSFRITAKAVKFIPAVILTVFLACLISEIKRFQTVIVVLEIGVTALIAFLNMDKLKKAGEFIEESFVRVSSSEKTLNDIPMRELTNDGLLFVILITFLLSMEFVIVLRSRQLMLLTIAIVLVITVLSCMCGHIPGIRYIAGILLSLIFYGAVYRADGNLRGILLLATSVLAASVIIFASYQFVPKVLTEKSAHPEDYTKTRKSIEREMERASKRLESVTRLFMNTNFAGASGGSGDIKNISKFNPEGKEKIEISVEGKPNMPVYIRTWAAVHYEDGKWNGYTNEEMDELDGVFSGSPNTLQNRAYDVAIAASADTSGTFTAIRNEGGLSLSRFDIRTVDGSISTGLIPTFAKNEYNVNYNLIPVRKDDGHYSYLWVRPETTFKVYQLMLHGEGMTGKSKKIFSTTKVFDDYSLYLRRKLYDEKKDIPKGISNLTEKLKNENLQTYEQIIDEALSGCTYDKEPGNVPEGKEASEYFLFENKKGFCMHFATVATLMYRQLSVPSRYVEGYIISPDKFTQSDEGYYTATVDDSMGHAWCEVFDENEGWIVKEHTKGYVKTDVNDNKEATPKNQNETKTENATAPVEEVTTKEEVTTRESVKEAESESKSNKEDTARSKKSISAKYVVTVLSIIALLILALLVRRYVIRKSYLSKIKHYGKNAAPVIYDEIIEIEEAVRGLKSEDTAEKTILKLKECCDVLSDDEWEFIYEISQRNAFSPDGISREETKELVHLCEKLRSEEYNRMSMVKKIKFKYINAK